MLFVLAVLVRSWSSLVSVCRRCHCGCQLRANDFQRLSQSMPKSKVWSNYEALLKWEWEYKLIYTRPRRICRAPLSTLKSTQSTHLVFFSIRRTRRARRRRPRISSRARICRRPDIRRMAPCQSSIRIMLVSVCSIKRSSKYT